MVINHPPSTIIHIDLAFPTSETSDIDDYQLYVEARAEF